jgi:beta-1,4-mannooligosaccharide/beta-1,4-mannosyl-N-acetylglucosamine phosphorylase
MIRSENNPLVSYTDIPRDAFQGLDVSSAFNPGAIKFEDKYLLLLRVQDRGRRTHIVVATSHDNLTYEISKETVHWQGIENYPKEILHLYDPRITKINDIYYIVFAMDTKEGCFLGLGKTSDFKSFDFLGQVSTDQSRNGVLFSEKFGEYYYRLERPNKHVLDSGVATGTNVILSKSLDLLEWEEVGFVFSGRPHYWDELIGSGTPPIKTKEGWLHLYHGVATHFSSANIYQAGVILLDLDNPTEVISRGACNILEPRELYETTGQVPNVVFPSGIIVEEYDEEGFAKAKSKVNIYYGAADTHVCLVESTIEELINLAKIK